MEQNDGESTSQSLVNLIRSTLDQYPGLAAKQIESKTSHAKSSVNSILYGHPDIFRKTEETPYRWFVIENGSAIEQQSISLSATTHRHNFTVDGLYPWQREALDAWNLSNRRGIVKAVTGTGKTRLALAAIADQINSCGKVAIIVPTIELQNQWKRELDKYFSGISIGLMGGGSKETLANHEIIIAIKNSASMRQLGLGDNTSGLLIADECHRLGSEVFKRALEEQFDFRLGLSATHERSDGAHETVLEPYFGQVVYTLNFRDAIDAGIIAHVRVATIGVDLNSRERTEYDELSERISETIRELKNKFAVATDPYHRFMEEITAMSKSGTRSESIAANRCLSAISKRRALLCETESKLNVLDSLVESIQNSNGTLVFTETIEGAKSATLRLNSLGISAVSMHSKMKSADRHFVFESFEAGRVKAIVSVHVLEEGIDVPEADFAIILATTKTPRQMIQRMGRVLRLKADGRVARFAITYVRDTNEDPPQRAHGAFFSEILNIADESKDFSSSTSNQEFSNFLSP